MKFMLALLAILCSSLAATAQNNYVIGATPCYPGPVICELNVVSSNWIDIVGQLYIAFPNQQPSHQGSFQVTENSGPNFRTITTYTPKVVWGYDAVDGIYSANFDSPLGRHVTLNFRYVTSIWNGTVWVIMPSSRVYGVNMAVK